MLNSKNTLMLAGPFTVMVACCLSLGVSGYFYEDSDPGALTQGQGSWRVKRMMNQISCHCCSNSFNSHCCAQCMQSRVGKRSDVLIPEDTSFLPDLSADTGSGVDSLGEEGSLGGNGLMCSCCMLQMHRRPFADSWPCCTECQRRYKRSASVVANAEDDKAKE